MASPAPTLDWPLNNDEVITLHNDAGQATGEVFNNEKVEGGSLRLEVGIVERRGRGETTQETAKVFERWSGSFSFAPHTTDGYPIFEQKGALLYLDISNALMLGGTTKFEGWVRITEVEEDGSDVNGYPIVRVDWVNHGAPVTTPTSSTKPTV